MLGSFSKLVETLAAEMRRGPRAGATAPRRAPTMPSLAKALNDQSKSVRAELADRNQALAKLASIKTGPTAADRDAAREQIRETMRHADQAFAAGRITGQELAELDSRARHLASSIP